MDEDFDYFLEKFGSAIEKQYVPPSSINHYRGKLPDQLLAYWHEYGWCGYAGGLFWTVNPQEYEPVLEAWLGDTPFKDKDAYHIIARSAFGEMFFWGEQTGFSLHIFPNYSMAFPVPGDEKWISQGKADDAMKWFFSGTKKEALDIEDQNGETLFAPGLKKLGRLKSDEIYGFVPALALGGPATLDHLQKVKAVEHLVLLAQLAPLSVLETPSF